MPQDKTNETNKWWSFGDKLSGLRESVNLTGDGLVNELNTLINAQNVQLKKIGADTKQVNGHIKLSKTDISKYENGATRPQRSRVLLFIYYFKNREKLNVEDANKLLESLNYSRLKEHTEQFQLFGEVSYNESEVKPALPGQSNNGGQSQNDNETEEGSFDAPTHTLVYSSLIVNQKIVLSDLSKKLQPGHIVGLYGPNGIGKTAIVNEFRQRWKYKPLAGFTKEPIYFNLKRCPERYIFIKKCVEKFELTNEQETWPAVESALEDSCRVIVLDGFDEVEASWPKHELDELLNAVFNNAFILTSCRIPGIGYPVEVPLLSDQHARELLISHCKKASDNWKVNDWKVVERILLSVGKLPLALELTGRLLATRVDIENHAQQLDENALHEVERLNNNFRGRYGDVELSQVIGVSIAKLDDFLCRRLLGQATLFGFGPFQKSMLLAAIEQPERYISDKTDEISDALDKLVIHGLLYNPSCYL